MSWAELATAFHLAPATDVLQAGRLERYQAWRDRVRWLQPDEPPLCVLFVSHRWETPVDPDPGGRQFRAVSRFIDLVVRCTRACLLPPAERAEYLPPVRTEGTLQAYTVAARMLDIEPMEPAFVEPGIRTREITQMAGELGVRSAGFGDWLASRIAVWIDYACVPQPPRSDAEVIEFRETLRRLPELMRATTLIALRYRDDHYAASGWCASESYLASRNPAGGGFARNLFVDIDGLLQTRPLYVPEGTQTAARAGSEEAAVIGESYRLASEAFVAARDALEHDPLPFIQSSRPRVWSAYVGLLSDSFHPSEADPSPTRHALELMIHFGDVLVQRWLLADAAVEVDLAELAHEQLARASLRCTAAEDGPYLALFLMSLGKLAVARPLCRDAFAVWAARMGRGELRALRARLHPSPAVRDLMRSLRPASSGVWHSRLTTGATRADERVVVDAVQRELARNPPHYELL